VVWLVTIPLMSLLQNAQHTTIHGGSFPSTIQGDVHIHPKHRWPSASKRVRGTSSLDPKCCVTNVILQGSGSSNVISPTMHSMIFWSDPIHQSATLSPAMRYLT
jgi:hypothetical protein